MTTNIAQMQEEKKEKFRIGPAFFWIAYAILLFISVPHAAYIFAAFSDNSWFEWTLAYCGAGLIEVSIYVSTYAMYKILKLGFKRNWVGFLGLFLWNIICTVLSWILNSAHAAHFQNNEMLTKTQGIPLSQFYAYISGSWPLLGIIFSLVSRIVTQKVIEITAEVIDHRSPEQIRKETEIKLALIQSEADVNAKISEINGSKTKRQIIAALGSTISGVKEGFKKGFETDHAAEHDNNNQQISVVEPELKLLEQQINKETIVDALTEQEPILLPLSQEEKLEKAIQLIKSTQGEVTDEAMAKELRLERLASARYWVLKATAEIEKEREQQQQTWYDTASFDEKYSITRQAFLANPMITIEQLSQMLQAPNTLAASTWLNTIKNDEENKRKQEFLLATSIANSTPSPYDGTPFVDEIVETSTSAQTSSSNGHIATLEEVEKKTKPIMSLQKQKKETTASSPKSLPTTPWEYKKVKASDVGYSSARPYFKVNGIIFCSITSAYQKESKKADDIYGYNLRNEKITYKSLYTLVQAKAIKPEYVTIVETVSPFGKQEEKKPAQAITVSIHEMTRDHILSIL